jgi:hypothetical protein
MFDDNFHICMIYGIEIKSINQTSPQMITVLSQTRQHMGSVTYANMYISIDSVHKYFHPIVICQASFSLAGWKQSLEMQYHIWWIPTVKTRLRTVIKTASNIEIWIKCEQVWRIILKLTLKKW